MWRRAGPRFSITRCVSGCSGANNGALALAGGLGRRGWRERRALPQHPHLLLLHRSAPYVSGRPDLGDREHRLASVSVPTTSGSFTATSTSNRGLESSPPLAKGAGAQTEAGPRLGGPALGSHAGRAIWERFPSPAGRVRLRQALVLGLLAQRG